MGFGWVDAGLALLVVTLAVLGWHRGLIAQVTSVLALIVGVWLGAQVEQWVGTRWTGAHPDQVFGVLKWLVAVTTALATAALLTLIGEAIGLRVQNGSVGWLDRAFGVPVGALIGLALAGLVTLALVTVPIGRSLERAVIAARTPRWLLDAGANVCHAAGELPGAHSTEQRFLTARSRISKDD